MTPVDSAPLCLKGKMRHRLSTRLAVAHFLQPFSLTFCEGGWFRVVGERGGGVGRGRGDEIIMQFSSFTLSRILSSTLKLPIYICYLLLL